MKRKKGHQIEMFVAAPSPEPDPVKAAPVVRDLTPQAEKLLANFEVLAEAEGGVKRLRELVLELAMRGRLVEHALDERQIIVENCTPPNDEYPSNWVISTIAEVAQLKSGNTFANDRELSFGDFPYVKVSDMNLPENQLDITTSSRFVAPEHHELRHVIPENSIIFPKRGGAIATNKKRLVKKPIFVDSNTMAIICPSFMDLKYMHIWFSGIDLWKLNSGTSVPQINNKDIGPLTIPLPPLAEQKRIVAKVDELMKLCDELEARQAKQRETGARLTKSALDALATAEGPAELAAAWKRVVGNFEGLVSRADDVKKVRETVLSLAVRGRLVKHESTSRKINNELAPSERPFVLPSAWHWAHLDNVVQSVTDGDHQPPPQSATGIPFLTIGNISSGYLDFEASRFVPIEYYDSLDPKRVPKQGDVLYTVVGASYGRAVLIQDNQKFCIQRHIAIIKPANQCDTNYLLIYLNSPLAYDQATKSITGTAQPTVPLKPLRKFKIPLPPLPEQKRIVAKVDQLMALCDELESKLRLAEETARKVAEALVAELLQA